MREFDKAREAYESVPIPEELDARVRAGIRQGKAAYRRVGRLRRSAMAAAACFVVLVGG